MYVWVTDAWVEAVESSVFLATPSPWIYIMFAHAVLRETETVRPQFTRLARVKFAYFTLARFLLACRTGLNPNETYDAGIEQPFIVPLPARLREIIDEKGIMLWLTGGVKFDRALALLEYRHSTEVDWATLSVVDHVFLWYAWYTGDVT